MNIHSKKPPHDSSSNDMIYWLAALRLENMGPVRIRRWLSQFGTIKQLFHASPAELQRVGLTEKEIHLLKNPNWKAAKNDLMWCEKTKSHLITYQDPVYPALLNEIYDGPLLLFVRGNVDLLGRSQLAVVGSRHPSVAGKELAKEFSYYLAQAKWVITSGLALGVDTASHQGALAATGATIAVLGTGLKTIYPASNRALADEIIEKGAVLSEFLPDTPPKANYFPRRNRVISGLSKGVLVVEAALRSGSLITARLAVEQGREVFAIPGSIHNPLARGCHYLIRQGAKLVETAEDILEELGYCVPSAEKRINPKPSLDPDCDRVFKQIGYEITSLDAIIGRSGLTPSEVCSMLLILELKGYVASVPGGYVRKPLSLHN